MIIYVSLEKKFEKCDSNITYIPSGDVTTDCSELMDEGIEEDQRRE